MRRSFVTRAAVSLLAMVLSAAFAVAVSTTPAHAKYGAMVHPTSGTVIKKIYRNCNGTSSRHGAIDIRNGVGTTIYAAYHGTVTRVWRNQQGGLNAELKHPNGYRTIYARMLSDHQKVYVGRQIAKGGVVGFMGNRGHNDGRSFLHFQVTRYGEVFRALNRGYTCGSWVTARRAIQVDFPGLS